MHLYAFNLKNYVFSKIFFCLYRQMNIQIDRYIHRYIHIYIHRQIYSQMNRQIDRCHLKRCPINIPILCCVEMILGGQKYYLQRGLNQMQCYHIQVNSCPKSSKSLINTWMNHERDKTKSTQSICNYKYNKYKKT